jgi:hypothetical protein
MALRGMSNIEKIAAAELKQKGFSVFWMYQGPKHGDYWATHPKLICQYHVQTTSKKALEDLENIILVNPQICNGQLTMEL